MTTLIAKNLKKVYGGREVVKDVSLEVNGGEVVGLLGPNGAGKTTTFCMTMGLVSPDAGEIYLDDDNITSLPMYKHARSGMGYLPQEDSVFRKLSVYDNLKGVAEYIYNSPVDQRNIIDKVLSDMHIEHLVNQKAYTLSGGERRRLEIARTLILRPKLLLMDEPFSGVDPISINDLQKIIITLKSTGIGILITDHNAHETLKIVDRAYIIHGGKILCHGTSSYLLQDENSRKFYLGENSNTLHNIFF